MAKHVRDSEEFESNGGWKSSFKSNFIFRHHTGYDIFVLTLKIYIDRSFPFLLSLLGFYISLPKKKQPICTSHCCQNL